MSITRFYEAEVRFATPTDGDTTTAERMEGHAILFNTSSLPLPVTVRGRKTTFVERIAPGALTRAVDASKTGEHNIFAYWSHDPAMPLGSTKGGKLSVAVDEKGLRFSLDTSRMTLAQIDAVRDGEIRMSFGFGKVAKENDDWAPEADGTFTRTIRELTLNEISPVTRPAYSDTSATLRSWEEEDAVRAIEGLDEETRADTVEITPTSRLDRLKAFAELHAKLI